MKKIAKHLLRVDKSEQYRTIDDLMEKGRPGEVYYTLLILSSVVVAAGLVLSNSAIVIGGMLITPLISPLLLAGLGLSVGDADLIRKVSLFIGKSLAVIVITSFALGLIFEVSKDPTLFTLKNTLNGAVLYFIVALSSGFAATFSWIRKEMSEILPGVAVSVALVPPLALIGIGLSLFDIEIIRSNLFVFFFNLLGIIVGSLLVFSLLQFYKSEDKVKQKIKEQNRDDEKDKNKKIKEEKEEEELKKAKESKDEKTKEN